MAPSKTSKRPKVNVRLISAKCKKTIGQYLWFYGKSSGKLSSLPSASKCRGEGSYDFALDHPWLGDLPSAPNYGLVSNLHSDTLGRLRLVCWVLGSTKNLSSVSIRISSNIFSFGRLQTARYRTLPDHLFHEVRINISRADLDWE